MRLLTHNFLQSNVRGTEKGYPLIIEPSEVLLEESPIDKELLTKMLTKIDYSAIVSAIRQLAPLCSTKEIVLPEVPADLPSDTDSMDDAALANLHTVLFDVHVLEGDLVCPDTGRKFNIKEGIPNMILHEDEI
mmetsp:Transcript_734/g.863  ORF Transcript_734/g.863 Transcript_734/m.863 type:complete len:133 (+) Transcript_734:118-516(+)|eukprot:CAMPEP_0195248676 /NCGR_PEP_ID=MMETSP0706-20130129/1676_1 /TAXON_ID=33640 /ORGANISM="Asterionellopsis glacialis, Strain CCMP134" /LENGTH=132 /DNA_ID=CAMNT_0040300361 /DNA_START=18 /DNA_END=416 /DNA_ORIENTATION=-